MNYNFRVGVKSVIVFPTKTLKRKGKFFFKFILQTLNFFSVQCRVQVYAITLNTIPTAPPTPNPNPTSPMHTPLTKPSSSNTHICSLQLHKCQQTQLQQNPPNVLILSLGDAGMPHKKSLYYQYSFPGGDIYIAENVMCQIHVLF